MYATFAELKQNREALIKAQEMNVGFKEGTQNLLTDLYPDTAHFIYELLQNAEDMNATTVRFILNEDGIEFEHNGTKRSFTIDDIDAITNIGHNVSKKDDPTSIGKFGIGFKSVMAYTKTPYIHSGKFHFKIEEYFVPQDEGVEPINTIDNNGVDWTKFYFPFNHPRKSKETAFQECMDGLKGLNATSILFLRNICKIEYLLPNAEYGCIAREVDKKFHVTTIEEQPDKKKTKKSFQQWLYFNKDICINDDKGNAKNLAIAIAFRLEENGSNRILQIVPTEIGKVFIYFPAEKEYSGLRFYINAPFASTAARASVRDCKENGILMQQIETLLVDSLPEIKRMGYMGTTLYEVFPNKKDNIPLFYSGIANSIYEAFAQNDYLPSKSHMYVSSKNAIMGLKTISDVIDDDALRLLHGIQKVWLNNAFRNSRADDFFNSLEIQKYTYADFVDIFGSQNRGAFQKWILTKDMEMLKKLYSLCNDAYTDVKRTILYGVPPFRDDMKKTVFIKSESGEMCTPDDIYILPENVSLLNKNTNIVCKDLISVSGERTTIQQGIKRFFEEVLDIKKYGPKIEIERILGKYVDAKSPGESYFDDILSFAKYSAENDDIEFIKYKLFAYIEKETGEVLLTYGNDLAFGKKYGEPCGDALVKYCGKQYLWDEYHSHYDSEELKIVMEFFKVCRICNQLQIVPQNVMRHPQYNDMVNSMRESYGNTRETESHRYIDYTIDNIVKLLSKKEFTISRLIWHTLGVYGNGAFKLEINLNQENRRLDYTKAVYTPNQSKPPIYRDSSLIYYLRKYAWVPNKFGKLCIPAEISINDIHEKFQYDKFNPLMVALKFGEGSDEEAKRNQDEIAQIGMRLKELGMAAISEERLRKLEKIEEMESRKEQQASSRSALDTLAAQTKNATSSSKTSASVEDIRQTFINKQKPVREIFSRFKTSTKEEKQRLESWYSGRCQMCGTIIKSYDHKNHFVARNVIYTQDLPSDMRRAMNTAWNSLCLCPNCAMRYQVCSKDISDLYDQIMEENINIGNNKVELYIQLDGKEQKITYCIEHFLFLKRGLQVLDEVSKRE